MEYACVRGQRRSPLPGLRGSCCGCGPEMIAKCGNFVRWHWAHKARERCDPWHESETDWHREWKSHFPEDWREVAHTDATSGEHHFADIKTEYGLVIEFQHFPIKTEELESREAFYENIIWGVDGNRTLDGVSFHGGVSAEPFRLSPVTYTFEFWGRGHLLESWQHANSPVFSISGTQSCGA